MYPVYIALCIHRLHSRAVPLLAPFLRLLLLLLQATYTMSTDAHRYPTVSPRSQPLPCIEILNWYFGNRLLREREREREISVPASFSLFRGDYRYVYSILSRVLSRYFRGRCFLFRVGRSMFLIHLDETFSNFSILCYSLQ